MYRIQILRLDSRICLHFNNLRPEIYVLWNLWSWIWLRRFIFFSVVYSFIRCKMPGFEGLVLGTEKPAAVFDIGRAYTKWVRRGIINSNDVIDVESSTVPVDNTDLSTLASCQAGHPSKTSLLPLLSPSPSIFPSSPPPFIHLPSSPWAARTWGPS